MRGFSDEATPHYISFESFGLPMQVRASSAELLALIEPLLPPPARRIPDPENAKPFAVVEEGNSRHSVWNPNTLISSHVGLELALITVEGQMRSWVALNAPNAIFVHAGVVGLGGEALVFPGNSFAGKTTLVAELVRRGAAYFSDEFAVIDPEGLVHPFPKPLSIRDVDEGIETQTPVGDIGGAAGDTALPMTLACVTNYVPGAEWQPRRLSRGEGALALLQHTVAARTRPEESMRFVTTATEGAMVLQGERGEVEEFAGMILDGVLV